MTMPDATALWLAERREQLTVNLLAQRPPAFDVPGDLDAQLTAWARALAAGESRNLILTGAVGTGKTWSAWHAAEVAVRAGYEGLVVVCPAATFRRIVAPSTADPQAFERLLAAGLLVLDDLGSVRLSEWDGDHLAEVADARWSAQLPTMVTSNVTDIRGLLGPRISSRLADRALIVELDGPDRRRQP
jgi:DNA replication protein DnaC